MTTARTMLIRAVWVAMDQAGQLPADAGSVYPGGPGCEVVRRGQTRPARYPARRARTLALSMRWAAARAKARGCSVRRRSWPRTARCCWTGSACSRGRARLISAVARGGSWTCWPSGSRRRAGSLAWTQIRRMPPWRPSLPPGGGWAAWRSSRPTPGAPGCRRARLTWCTPARCWSTFPRPPR